MQKRHVLLVEDRPEVIYAVRPLVSSLSCDFDYARTMHHAMRKLESTKYDVIILDRILPDGDGIDLLPAIDELCYTARTIVLSEKSTAGQKVQGLNAGADDYLQKPFVPEELSARIQAVLRRAKPLHTRSHTLLSHTTVFSDERKMRYGKYVQSFTQQEWDLLQLFFSHEERTLSRASIAEKLWSADSYPSNSSIDVIVMRLRNKLLHFPFTIQTRRGVGYALVHKKR